MVGVVGLPCSSQFAAIALPISCVHLQALASALIFATAGLAGLLSATTALLTFVLYSVLTISVLVGEALLFAQPSALYSGNQWLTCTTVMCLKCKITLQMILSERCHHFTATTSTSHASWHVACAQCLSASESCCMQHGLDDPHTF